jgi:dephospho-CoA kinase
MIITVSGKAGAGKDTIADYLINRYNFTKISLADPIKRMVQDVFALSENTVYDRNEREKPLNQWGGKSVRQFLQLIGTELFRDNIDQDIWVKSLYLKIKDSLKEYVIPDVRFPNELNYLKNNVPKGELISIKVIRAGCDGVVGINNHRSESFELNTDYTIQNNGTVEELYEKIENIMIPICGKLL